MRFRRFLAASSVAIACCSGAQAGQIGFNLVEESSTLLTSNLSGLTITNLAPDSWLVDFSGTGITLAQGNNGNNAGGTMWAEPDSNLVNLITILNTLQLRLDSDVVPTANSLNCGANRPLNGQTCYVGSGNGNDYFVNVVDVADAAVPEPGVLALVGAALGAAAFFSRRKA